MDQHGITEVTDELEHLQASSPTCTVAVSIDPAIARTLEAPRPEAETPSSELSNISTDHGLMDQLAATEPESLLSTSEDPSIDTGPPILSYQRVPGGLYLIQEQGSPTGRKKRPLGPGPIARPVTQWETHSSRSIARKTPEKQKSFDLSFQHVTGPGQEKFPVHIHGILERWHKINPEELDGHPCATGPPSLENYKVFNEDAEEFQLSLWRVRKKCDGKVRSYHVLLLHSENGPEELVIKSRSRPTWTFSKACEGLRGYYLFAWLEAKASFEDVAQLLWVSRTDTNKITFDTRLFDYGNRRGGPMVSEIGKKSLEVLRDRFPYGQKFEVDFASSSDPFISDGDSELDHHEPDTGPVKKSGNLADKFRGLTSPRAISDSKSKRAKTDPKNNATANAAVQPFEPQARRPTARFKLALSVPVSQTFRPPPVGLICEYPGLEEVQFVGIDCNDEFDILMNEIRRASPGNGEEKVVTVKAV
ncbi:unnamed protein product [Penicillium bialowiezense]